MLNKSPFAALLITLSSLPVGAADWLSSGYLKSYGLFQDAVNSSLSNDSSSLQSQNALRLMGNYFADQANVEVHYEVLPLYSNHDLGAYNTRVLGQTLTRASNSYRFKDFSATLIDGSTNALVLQNLDRLNVQFNRDWGDITIGRQVVSFGSARFINPTDIFIPYALQTLNQEYRIGIDAVRTQIAVGDFSTLDLGLIIGADAKKQNSAAFVRYQQSIAGNDIEAIIIHLNDASLYGIGLERALGDFGIWFESAWLDARGDKVDIHAQAEGDSPAIQPEFVDSYWRMSLGFDYALTEKLYVATEYHQNGAGSDNPDDYVSLAQSAPYQRGGVYLFGKHYLIPSLSYQFSALTVFSGSVFANLSDQSIFYQIKMERSWSDNLYSDLGIYLSQGDDIYPENGGIKLGSEFGAYPPSIYASIRYYF
ncbi:hypothetical protein [Thalassotalea mangrovi]|uniref:DUF1302 domain-containing protein n=1 Tax=Thalassotalea mangrovi TaxID=2572245 RepID=A0A4U1B3F4_9GAMM|nr:hypothetical protein [Thalassotalea mangrovi]TKB44417.1 hypothetical protein E8M12_12245 [Thalassotalea mangrovi]